MRFTGHNKILPGSLLQEGYSCGCGGDGIRVCLEFLIITRDITQSALAERGALG